MEGVIINKDLEQMLQEKKAERNKCVEEQLKIRKGVTDADFTQAELKGKEQQLKGNRAYMLPTKIIYELQPLQSKEYRLDTEINSLEQTLKKYKRK